MTNQADRTNEKQTVPKGDGTVSPSQQQAVDLAWAPLTEKNARGDGYGVDPGVGSALPKPEASVPAQAGPTNGDVSPIPQANTSPISRPVEGVAPAPGGDANAVQPQGDHQIHRDALPLTPTPKDSPLPASGEGNLRPGPTTEGPQQPSSGSRNLSSPWNQGLTGQPAKPGSAEPGNEIPAATDVPPPRQTTLPDLSTPSHSSTGDGGNSSTAAGSPWSPLRSLSDNQPGSPSANVSEAHSAATVSYPRPDQTIAATNPDAGAGAPARLGDSALTGSPNDTRGGADAGVKLDTTGTGSVFGSRLDATDSARQGEPAAANSTYNLDANRRTSTAQTESRQMADGLKTGSTTGPTSRSADVSGALGRGDGVTSSKSTPGSPDAGNLAGRGADATAQTGMKTTESGIKATESGIREGDSNLAGATAPGKLGESTAPGANRGTDAASTSSGLPGKEGAANLTGSQAAASDAQQHLPPGTRVETSDHMPNPKVDTGRSDGGSTRMPDPKIDSGRTDGGTANMRDPRSGDGRVATGPSGGSAGTSFSGDDGKGIAGKGIKPDASQALPPGLLPEGKNTAAGAAGNGESATAAGKSEGVTAAGKTEGVTGAGKTDGATIPGKSESIAAGGKAETAGASGPGARDGRGQIQPGAGQKNDAIPTSAEGRSIGAKAGAQPQSTATSGGDAFVGGKSSGSGASNPGGGRVDGSGRVDGALPGTRISTENHLGDPQTTPSKPGSGAVRGTDSPVKADSGGRGIDISTRGTKSDSSSIVPAPVPLPDIAGGIKNIGQRIGEQINDLAGARGQKDASNDGRSGGGRSVANSGSDSGGKPATSRPGSDTVVPTSRTGSGSDASAPTSRTGSGSDASAPTSRTGAAFNPAGQTEISGRRPEPAESAGARQPSRSPADAGRTIRTSDGKSVTVKTSAADADANTTPVKGLAGHVALGLGAGFAGGLRGIAEKIFPQTERGEKPVRVDSYLPGKPTTFLDQPGRQSKEPQDSQGRTVKIGRGLDDQGTVRSEQFTASLKAPAGAARSPEVSPAERTLRGEGGRIAGASGGGGTTAPEKTGRAPADQLTQRSDQVRAPGDSRAPLIGGPVPTPISAELGQSQRATDPTLFSDKAGTAKDLSLPPHLQPRFDADAAAGAHKPHSDAKLTAQKEKSTVGDTQIRQQGQGSDRKINATDRDQLGGGESEAERLLADFELVIESGNEEDLSEEVRALRKMEFFQRASTDEASDDETVEFDAIGGSAGNDEEQTNRYDYMVEPGDTLESISTEQLKDVGLAPLLYQINQQLVKLEVVNGQIVFVLTPGTIISLPHPREIEQFYGDSPAPSPQ